MILITLVKQRYLEIENRQQKITRVYIVYPHIRTAATPQTKLDENVEMTHRLPADDFIMGSTVSSN